MKVIYKHYEPNQGLEEQQAKVYTEVSGLPTDTEGIKRRFKGQKRDPKSARYVLTEDNKLLAYVQTSEWVARPGTFMISYPWALPDCPLEAQEKIFDELLAWLKETINPQVIFGEVVFDTPTTNERIEFFQRKGFIEKEHLLINSVDLDLSEISKWERNNEIASYTCRSSTTDDLEQLIELCHADNYTRDVFTSVDEATYFIKNLFLKNSHNKLILKDNQIVSAGFPYRRKVKSRKNKGKEEEVIRMESATRLEHPQALKKLVIEIAKECLKAGWENLPLRISSLFFAYEMNAIFLAELQEGFEDFAALFAYQD